MTIIIGILGLGFLVFFHELGHFSAARIFGVKVEAFSVGMGPILLHHKIKDTDYRLSLIPLGGYCSMKGEKDFTDAIEKNLREIDGEPDSFYGVHPFKRLLIAFAGPFFNFLFGFIAYTIIALMGYTYYSAGTKVSMADEVYTDMSSVAHKSGMMTGDAILSINSKKMEDFSQIAIYVSSHPDEDLDFEVERNGEILHFLVHSELDKETGSGKVGIVSNPESIIERTYPKHSFFSALAEGFKQSFNLINLTFKGIGTLFKGVNITNTVSGPARITSMLGSTIKQGFSAGIHEGIVSSLEFLAIISISLFITNLLPIPILDGGLILFALIECIIRKKLNPKFLYYIQFVGIAFLAFMLILAVTGDFMYFFKK